MQHYHQLHAISLLCRDTLQHVQRLSERFEAVETWFEEDYDDEDDDSQASVYNGEYEVASETESASEASNSEIEEGEIAYVDAATDMCDLQIDSLGLEDAATLTVELAELEDELIKHGAGLSELLTELQHAHQPGEKREMLGLESPEHRSRKIARKA